MGMAREHLPLGKGKAPAEADSLVTVARSEEMLPPTAESLVPVVMDLPTLLITNGARFLTNFLVHLLLLRFL